MPRNGKGFTLVEIMVVVVILGILAVLIVPRVLGRSDEARIAAAKHDIAALSQSLKLYKLDNGRYPSNEQGLQALVTQPSGDPQPRNWLPGGYAKMSDLKDPWQNALQYRVPGEHNAHSFDLFSYGADGTEGGEGPNADVTNWDNGA